MRSVRRRTAVVLGMLLLSGTFVYTTGWPVSTHHPPTVPVDSSPARPQQPTASAPPRVPRDKPIHQDSVTAESNGRLVDAYLFFLTALSSHRARGAMNGSGGLGHDPHHSTTTSLDQP